ncbi:hypothetical protein F4604DRAFT_1570834, partial [Suillus subluteus]
LNNQHHTPILQCTPNPAYAAKDVTFYFPISLSLADTLGSVEPVIRDEDTLKLKKEYIGEVTLTLELDSDSDLLANGLGFSAETNEVCFSPPYSCRLHIDIW